MFHLCCRITRDEFHAKHLEPGGGDAPKTPATTREEAAAVPQ